MKTAVFILRRRSLFESVLIRVILFFLAMGCQLLACDNEDIDIGLRALEETLTKLHDQKIKIMPADVRAEILKCESAAGLNNVSEKSQVWLHQNFGRIDDLELAEMLSSFKDIRGADDVYKILSDAFWCRLHGKPLDLEGKIASVGLYWKENEKPGVRFAPIGRGQIDWLWKLEVKDRPHGVIHVGVDKKTRNFICYEQPIGVYYPEGDILERIRAEIVQDPARSGRHIGRGLLQR